MGIAAQGWIELAEQMITQYGRSSAVTFTRVQKGNYETSTLSRQSLPDITYECVAAPLDFNIKQIDKVNITTGQKMLWIPGTDTSGNTVSPQVGDIVALERNYKVLEITAYETESTNCAFLLKIGE